MADLNILWDPVTDFGKYPKKRFLKIFLAFKKTNWVSNWIH